MAYDLLVRNGRVVDGSGMPAFLGDVGIANRKIVEVGKLSGPAARVIDVQGQVISPGFIDNHCHYDAQAVWDPLCTFSCYHGATTVVNGNCSLGLAPAREADRYALTSMLSRVEAIPLGALQAGMEWSWETIPEYLGVLDRRLGVNVGALIGFSAVRLYAMGEAAYAEQATTEQIGRMKAIIREGMAAGALGLSSERNLRHMDIEGRVLPANIASPEELLAVAESLAEVGAGSIQFGDAERVEEKEGLITRLAQVTGRPIIPTFGGARGSNLDGSRVYPMVDPFVENPARWTLLTVATFDLVPTWGTVMTWSPDERRRAFEDPEMRAKLRAGALTPDPRRAEAGPAIRWEVIQVANTTQERNRHWVGQTVAEIAQAQGKDPLDAFLDLGLDEDLATVFFHRSNVSVDFKAAAVRNPRIILGLSDSGAHVTRRCNSHFSTHILSYWVRETQTITLEEAVRKLTYVPAAAFGMHDRGLIRPGLVADLTVFDPDTVRPGEMDETSDFPGGATRMRRLCQGVDYTIVNGEVLIEEGEHTGAYPGRVVRGSAYAAHAQ